MTISHVEGMFTDQIESVGNVKRMYFQALVVFDDGSKEWHYFGTTLADVPARTTDPAFEHAYVQFPQGLDDLDADKAEDFLYELGILSGFRREGLTSPGD
jgi:hypothetical protein